MILNEIFNHHFLAFCQKKFKLKTHYPYIDQEIFNAISLNNSKI